MAVKLYELPYEHNALEPVISEETVKYHHDIHHQTYVDNYNKAVEGTDLEGKDVAEVLRDLDAIPEDIRQAVINNGGGVFNHNQYWEIMTPGGSKEPVGKLKEAIEEAFGSYDDFKEKFEEAGAGQFGSGWASLVEKDGKVEIIKTANQNTPHSDGYNIIFSNDVWEHTYYIDYRNKRAEYLSKWWDLVNWDIAEERYNG